MNLSQRFRWTWGAALFGVVVWGVQVACASDTIALYPFDDGEPGETANGKTIKNAVDGSYPGDVTVTADADIVFDEDVPGKYVLSCSFEKNATPEILYTNPRSAHFVTTGGTITFPGLSTALSSNEDYTVEFFYKVRDEDRTTAGPVALKYDVGTQFAGSEYFEPGIYPTYLQRSADTYWQLYYVGYTADKTRTTLSASLAYSDQSGWSGAWHHMALVYSHEAKTLTAYSDYDQRNRHVVLSGVTNTVLDEPKALEIGMKGFKGLISCLRLSKKALAVADFLHASHLKAYPEETVFHWTCDGTSGTTPDVVTNVAYGGYPYAGQFLDWQATPKLYSGNGTVHVASKEVDAQTVTLAPTWSDVLPFGGMDQVAYDGEKHENIGSLRLDVLPRTEESSGVDGSGVYLAGTDHQFVDGSFTMETTMKLDYTDWRAKLNSTFTRYAIFGLYSDVTYTFDFQLSAIQDGDGVFRLTGNAYLPSPRELIKFCAYNGEPGARPQGYDPNFLKDGAWHHFALVYDDSDYTFKVYVDYKEVSTYVADRPYRPINTSVNNRNYWFGGDKMKHSGFQGWMDEARMTRRALQPEEFIRFSRDPHTYYVDPVDGDDGNTGREPTAAFKTLAGAMANPALATGDTVCLKPGVYAEETMEYGNVRTLNRLVLRQGVNLTGLGDKPEDVVIKGAVAPVANQVEGADGCGEGATRCVKMLGNSVIRNVTLDGGRVYVNGTASTNAYDACAAAHCTGEGNYLINCLITNCVGLIHAIAGDEEATVKAGGRSGLIRCRICGNRTISYAGCQRLNLYNCAFYGNTGSYSVHDCYDVVNCTIMDTSSAFRESSSVTYCTPYNCVIWSAQDCKMTQFYRCIFPNSDANAYQGGSGYHLNDGCRKEPLPLRFRKGTYEPKRDCCLTDAGNDDYLNLFPAAFPEEKDLDLYGHARVIGAAVDVGAGEYLPSDKGMLLLFR